MVARFFAHYLAEFRRGRTVLDLVSAAGSASAIVLLGMELLK
jgi:hypothetical protein